MAATDEFQPKQGWLVRAGSLKRENIGTHMRMFTVMMLLLCLYSMYFHNTFSWSRHGHVFFIFFTSLCIFKQLGFLSAAPVKLTPSEGLRSERCDVDKLKHHIHHYPVELFRGFQLSLTFQDLYDRLQQVPHKKSAQNCSDL